MKIKFFSNAIDSFKDAMNWHFLKVFTSIIGNVKLMEEAERLKMPFAEYIGMLVLFHLYTLKKSEEELMFEVDIENYPNGDNFEQIIGTLYSKDGSRLSSREILSHLFGEEKEDHTEGSSVIGFSDCENDGPCFPYLRQLEEEPNIIYIDRPYDMPWYEPVDTLDELISESHIQIERAHKAVERVFNRLEYCVRMVLPEAELKIHWDKVAPHIPLSFHSLERREPLFEVVYRCSMSVEEPIVFDNIIRDVRFTIYCHIERAREIVNEFKDLCYEQ